MINIVRAVVTMVVASACGIGHAQEFPVKQIFLVLPYPAGGGMDSFTRALAARMSEDWRQPVLIDNRPGANAIIGTDLVVKAPPDGYTLLVTDPSLVINPGLYRLPYNSMTQLTAVASLVAVDQVLAVNPSLPARSAKEFIDLAKAKPGELSYGSLGIGSSAHLAGELLQQLAGIKLNHIPYKGPVQALGDVTNGNLQMMVMSYGNILPFAKAGKVRMLGIASGRRIAEQPDLPKISDSAVPGFEVYIWYGLSAPAATPRPVIERINAQVRKVLADPAFRAKYLDPHGLEPVAGSPEDATRFLVAEADKWGRIMRNAGVKPE
jgi:tripartite-type tricarboxylate transporter receptor subunit TctC